MSCRIAAQITQDRGGGCGGGDGGADGVRRQLDSTRPYNLINSLAFASAGKLADGRTHTLSRSHARRVTFVVGCVRF